MILDPSDYGFPPTYESFRPAQIDVVDYILTSDARFVAIGAPTGIGKSGISVLTSKLSGTKSTILTASLGLENQYLSTFPGMLASIRGRANYPCWEGGNCLEGQHQGCGDRDGCPYICALKAANEHDRPLTNYPYWMSVNQNGAGMVKPDILILDEAHLAPDWLSASLDFHIHEFEYRRCGGDIGDLPHQETIEVWAAMGDHIHNVVAAQYHRLKARMSSMFGTTKDRAMREFREVDSLLDRVNRLKLLNDNWLISMEEGTDKGRVFRFECIWPGMYRERLFQGVEKVVLLSATLRPKTLSYMGIPKADTDFKEWPRQFPAENGPVYHIPTAAVGRKMTDEDTRRWLNRIAEICAWGNDRKGLVHSVSYDRARQIRENLPAFVNPVVNGAADPASKTATEAYDRFMISDNGSVLLSPSFSTGWDFSGPNAEYQIVSKLAYPNLGSKLVKARIARDSDYMSYVAAQDLVQACGRINRYSNDLGVTFIIDDNVTQLIKRGSSFMPRWFKVKSINELPAPLPKL